MASRDHLPIQIGLPREPAWHVAEPAPLSYIAFIAGEQMPDPGDAFLAAGCAFAAEPRDVEPLPIDDEQVAWAFGFRVARRDARVLVWCERAQPGQTPDGAASDACWVILVETLLDATRPVEDAIALAATAAAAGGARTLLLYDPTLGVTWQRREFSQLFLGENASAGALVDERHLYRVELVARDNSKGPYWLSSVGLARLAKPELELLEVPVTHVRAALELMDALAARFITNDLPDAGVPFEAGPGLSIALVPVHEVIETLSLGAAGDAHDRRALPPGPRAVVCAAQQRGAFRKIWMPPLDELQRLAAHETGLYLAPRVVDVRQRLAQQTWDSFMAAHAARDAHATAIFVAKVSLPMGAATVATTSVDDSDERAHVWVEISSLSNESCSGVVTGGARAGASDGVIDVANDVAVAARTVSFARADVGDWRILGWRSDLAEVGPESATLLD